jgi:hypothetical protein
MKFGGHFHSNFMNANGSKDAEYKKDLILDEVSRLIEFNRQSVISNLNDAGYKISPDSSKKTVIDYTSKALYENPEFRKGIAKNIVASNSGFNGADGSAGGAGKSASPAGAIAGAIGQSLESIFGFAQASKEYKSEQERTRQQMYDKLLQGEKTNWMPIIIVGSVLLIGGIVVFMTLRKK